MHIFSSAILCLFLSLPCVAQDLVPVIRLSDDEVVKAKQLVQALKEANERSARVKVAWEQFHQFYQAAHPDLPGLGFTADCRFAITLRNSSTTADVHQVATIELTAEERQKLETLHREMSVSEQSQKQAVNNWLDFKYQLVIDHVGSTAEGYSERTLSSGKPVKIFVPWNRGLAFTTDFRLAIPYENPLYR